MWLRVMRDIGPLMMKHIYISYYIDTELYQAIYNWLTMEPRRCHAQLMSQFVPDNLVGCHICNLL